MYYGPVCLLAYSTWTLISSILSNCCWWMYSSCIQCLSNNTSTRKLSKISEIGHIHSKEIHLMIKRVSSYCKIGNTKVDQHVVSVQIFKEAFVRRHKISEEFFGTGMKRYTLNSMGQVDHFTTYLDQKQTSCQISSIPGLICVYILAIN